MLVIILWCLVSEDQCFQFTVFLLPLTSSSSGAGRSGQWWGEQTTVIKCVWRKVTEVT